jgi:hypothetical protein
MSILSEEIGVSRAAKALTHGCVFLSVTAVTIATRTSGYAARNTGEPSWQKNL